jgi:hypothetical protein
MKNETTGRRVARIAGRILEAFNSNYDGVAPIYAMNRNSDLFLVGTSGKGRYVTIGDLKTLAASALTQAPDRTMEAIKAMPDKKRREFVKQFNELKTKARRK